MKKSLLILIMILASSASYAKSNLLKLPYSLEIGKVPLQSTYDLTNKGKEEKQKSGNTYHIIENRLQYWTNERGEVTSVQFYYTTAQKLPKVYRNIGLNITIQGTDNDKFGVTIKDGTTCNKLQEILKKEEGFHFLEHKPGDTEDDWSQYIYLVENKYEYTFSCTTKRNILEIFGLYGVSVSKYTDFDY